MALLLPVNLRFPPLPPPAASLGFSSFSCSLFPNNHRIPVKSIPVLHSHSNGTFPFPGPQFEFREKARGCRLRIAPRCSANSENEESRVVKEKSVSVILLAGGKGKRMGASMPKQYIQLLGQPIALYSLYTFSQLIEVKEIIVVCDPSYKDIFEGFRSLLSLARAHVFVKTKEKIHVELKFTLPGKERQDSVYSGLQAIDLSSELVCIHDSARPLVSSGDIEKKKRLNLHATSGSSYEA